MRCRTGVVAFSVAIGLALSLSTVRAAPFMIVGNDEKVLWDDQGKPVQTVKIEVKCENVLVRHDAPPRPRGRRAAHARRAASASGMHRHCGS